MPRLDSLSTSHHRTSHSTTTTTTTYLADLHALWLPRSNAAGRRWQHAKHLLLRSVRFKLAPADTAQMLVPLRVRPAFIVLNVLDLVLLGLLGFHPNAQAWTRLNDKVLHFICFFLATSLFYMVWDVDESARRVWIWRNAALLLTFLTCFAGGSIGSEVVQSFLPYKTFDAWDVASNMLGSSLGLFFTYHLELRYRARREIESLYDPLDQEGGVYDDLLSPSSSSFGDEEGREGIGLRHATLLSPPSSPPASAGEGVGKGGRKVRFGSADVWQREEEVEGGSMEVWKGEVGQEVGRDGSIQRIGHPLSNEGGGKKGKENLFAIASDDDEEEGQ